MGGAVTRRSFLRGLAVVGAAVASSGLLAEVVDARGRLETVEPALVEDAPGFLFLRGDIIEVEGVSGQFVVIADGGADSVGRGTLVRIGTSTRLWVTR